MLWLLTWAVFTLGGALCCLFSLGILTMSVFFVSVPYGASAGFVLGAPLSPIVAVTIMRFASPPKSVGHFVWYLELLGIVIANAIPAAFILLIGAGQIFALSNGALVLANILGSLAATTLTGRGCGRLLAVAHLRACGIAPPRSRLRLHRPVRSRRTQAIPELGVPTRARAADQTQNG